jgi:TetR/AcrR family transcriptional regulator, cholesterol catabolism regulator
LSPYVTQRSLVLGRKASGLTMTAPNAPSGAPLSSKRSARRQKILTTALNLTKGYGFENVQIREISETSGLSLGTVYRYFSSKEFLFACVFERWCEEYYARLGRPAGPCSNTDRLIELSKRSVEAFEREPQFTLLSATLQTSSDPEVIACIERIRRQSVEFFLESIDDIPPEDARAIVDIIFAVMAEKLLLWRTDRMPIADVFQGVERCVRLLLEFRDPAGNP